MRRLLLGAALCALPIWMLGGDEEPAGAAPPASSAREIPLEDRAPNAEAVRERAARNEARRAGSVALERECSGQRNELLQLEEELRDFERGSAPQHPSGAPLGFAPPSEPRELSRVEARTRYHTRRNLKSGIEDARGFLAENCPGYARSGSRFGL